VLPILRCLELRKHTAPQAWCSCDARTGRAGPRGVGQLAHGRKVHCVAVYGRKPIRAQIDKLKRGVDVVVGTPAACWHHLGRGTIVLDKLKFVVLDEADRMLDIGFGPTSKDPASLSAIAANAAFERHGAAARRAAGAPLHAATRSRSTFSPGEGVVDSIEQVLFHCHARD